MTNLQENRAHLNSNILINNHSLQVSVEGVLILIIRKCQQWYDRL